MIELNDEMVTAYVEAWRDRLFKEPQDQDRPAVRAGRNARDRHRLDRGGRVKLPSPYMLLVIHICFQASLCSAFAPLFGNHPFTEGVLGLWVGFLTGLPFYVAAMIRRTKP